MPKGCVHCASWGKSTAFSQIWLVEGKIALVVLLPHVAKYKYMILHWRIRSGSDWWFKKNCGSGLDRIQFCRIRTGLRLKNCTVRSSLVLTHCSCCWGFLWKQSTDILQFLSRAPSMKFKRRVFTPFSGYWWPLWKQIIFKLQLLLGAPLKTKHLHITVSVGALWRQSTYLWFAL